MAIYKEDFVDIDLKRGNIHRSFLKHSIGMADDAADHFGIRVYRGRTPVDLTGASVQGYFRDPNGNNIAITSGNIVSGNEAAVILPQACYNYEGQFTLSIKLIGGGITGTMRIVDGVVDNTNTGGAVAPTSAVPTYQEVLAVYDEMVELVDSVSGDFTELKNEFNYESIANGESAETGDLLMDKGLFDRNVYNPNGGYVNEYPYRISARRAIVFPFYVTLIIAAGFRMYPYFYSSSQWTGDGWKTGSFNIEANVPFYCQIARAEEDESEVADVNEFLKQVTVKGGFYDIQTTELEGITESLTYQFKNWESGGWNAAQGSTPEKDPLTGIRIRSRNMIKAPRHVKVNIKQAGVRVVTFYADENGKYLGTNANDTSVGYYDHYLANNPSAKKVFLTVIFSNVQSIPSDLDDYFVVEFNNNSAVTEGKNVFVYHFGGAGNDWCFVRTPSGYDSMRNKPYPFVICNHGNGWTMDGTLAKANWTKRTMYVPTDDPDYIADPTEYNGTSDSSLWYSNPTIEALLTAGYVVCGCENYADEQYGNNPCRNACVDFFHHMVKTYNVEGRCYMIGASNGAMTSLNAAYILQGKVKAMILQYPLTCLVNQYQQNANQRAGIRAAYGITDADISIDALTKAVATHDPLTVDVIDGKKVGTFPPVKLYYSPDDAVVKYQYNTIPLSEMLDNSGKVVETVQCSGEHGDHTHFAPADYVAWFNAN